MSQAIYPVARGNEDPFGEPHTPGPWQADLCGWPYIVNGAPAGESPNVVAIVYPRELETAPARSEQFPELVAAANCRLIAAAPDLLQALRDAAFCLRTFRNVPLADQAWTSVDEDALQQAFAAIAAATTPQEVA